MKFLINKPQWLTHIHILMELTLQECIINIKLINGPTTTNCQTKNKLNGGRFDYWVEGVMVINSWSLMKTLCNQPSCKPVNRTIRVTFYTKKLLTSNNIVTRIRGYELPSPIPNKSIIFFSMA